MINPGSGPVYGGTEAEAAANLQIFIDEATEQGLRLVGEPERCPGEDADGRFGWVLSLANGDRVPVLMPGADLAKVRDDLSAQAYCIKVRDNWWWWRAAVGMVIPFDR